MSMATFLIVAAILLVVGSLGMGIASMAHHGTVGRHTSEEWMWMRVIFQGLALALILVAALS